MGYVRFSAERFVAARQRQPRRIGSIPRFHTEYTLSTIVLDPLTKQPVFGAEIPITTRDTTCTIWRRHGDALSPQDYRRLEFTIDLKVARTASISQGSQIFVAELPLAQRRVHLLKVQGYCDRLDPVVFEDLDHVGPPFESLESRKLATPEAARQAIHALAKDPFTSQHALTAALSDTELNAFSTFDDPHPDQVRKRKKDSTFAIAAVNDPEDLRQAIMRDKRLMKSFAATGEGTLFAASNMDSATIPIPQEVSNTAPLHLDIAVKQAMCGAGSRAKDRIGQPVADYARHLFEQHMLAALRRRDGDLIDYSQFPFDGDGDDFEDVSERPLDDL